MSKLEEIESEVKELSPAELTDFRRWFAKFDAELWDRRIERDAASGRLDKLAERALSQHAAGSSTEL